MKKKKSFWSWLADFVFYGEDKKSMKSQKLIVPQKPSTEISDKINAPAFVSNQDQDEILSEIEQSRNRLELDYNLHKEKMQRAELREERWFEFQRRRSLRENIRFQKAILRDARKRIRQSIQEKHETERELDGIFKWLETHTSVSRLTELALKMVGAIVTGLKIQPELVSFIQENNNLDILKRYLEVLDDLVVISNRLEQAEESINGALEYFERQKQEEFLRYVDENYRLELRGDKI